MADICQCGAQDEHDHAPRCQPGSQPALDYLFIGGPLHGKTLRTGGEHWFDHLERQPVYNFDPDPDPTDHGPRCTRITYRLETVAIAEPARSRPCYVMSGLSLQSALHMLNQWLLEQWVKGGPEPCQVPGCWHEGTQEVTVGGHGMSLAMGWFQRGSTLRLCMRHLGDLANVGAPGCHTPPWIGATPVAIIPIVEPSKAAPPTVNTTESDLG